MKTRRDMLKSGLALCGVAVLRTHDSQAAPSLLPSMEEFSFESLNLPEDAIGVRFVMRAADFEEWVKETKILGDSGWGIGRELHRQEDGTRWTLLSTLRQNHSHFKTKEEAVTACQTGGGVGRVPFYNLVAAENGFAGINPEWRTAEWMVVTILRFKPQPIPSEVFIGKTRWFNEYTS